MFLDVLLCVISWGAEFFHFVSTSTPPSLYPEHLKDKEISLQIFSSTLGCGV